LVWFAIGLKSARPHAAREHRLALFRMSIKLAREAARWQKSSFSNKPWSAISHEESGANKMPRVFNA
jgi:hypothetical protein